jgi:hypothetical protein
MGMRASAHRVDNPFPGCLGQAHISNDSAGMEDENTVGHLKRFIDVRGRDQNGRKRGDITDRLGDVMPRVDVDASERLIE